MKPIKAMNSRITHAGRFCPGRRSFLGSATAAALGVLLLGALDVCAMQIFVSIAQLKTISVDVEPTDTIAQIKTRIQDSEGILVQQQRLFVPNKVGEPRFTLAEDSLTIADYGVQGEDTLKLRVLGLPFSMHWFKVAGGGAGAAQSSNGRFELIGTVGQHDATPQAENGRFSLTAGYWSIVAVIQTEGAPLLTVHHSGGNAVVSWPSPAGGWILQQTEDAANPNWFSSPYAIADDGVDRSVFVPASTGNRYFRLIKPQ
jgi:hypothetical protein